MVHGRRNSFFQALFSVGFLVGLFPPPLLDTVQLLYNTAIDAIQEVLESTYFSILAAILN